MKAAQFVVVVSSVVALSTGLVHGEQAKMIQPGIDPAAKDAAMEAMQRLGSPSEGHKALDPLVGNWTYTLEWRMSPEAALESMTGSTTNSLIFGGRFLRQEVRGDMDGQPFEGLGILGYDNIRKAYQSVWFDSMGTGLMTATGQFDAATKTLTEQGEFSCPMTGEAHRWFRSAWKVVDPNHTTYESYSHAPDGTEFKSMEIRYTRAQ